MREAINQPAANYDTYCCILNNDFNISFFVAKKDQCEKGLESQYLYTYRTNMSKLLGLLRKMGNYLT